MSKVAKINFNTATGAAANTSSYWNNFSSSSWLNRMSQTIIAVTRGATTTIQTGAAHSYTASANARYLRITGANPSWLNGLWFINSIGTDTVVLALNSNGEADWVSGGTTRQMMTRSGDSTANAHRILDAADNSYLDWYMAQWDRSPNSGSSSDGGNNAVGTGSAAWIDEAIVSQGAWYVATYRELEISGLDPSRLYTLDFYSSFVTSAGAKVQRYTVTGVGGYQDLEAYNNSSNIVTFTDVAPDADGCIRFRDTGQTASATYINAMRVTEQPPVGRSLQGMRAGFCDMNGNLM